MKKFFVLLVLITGTLVVTAQKYSGKKEISQKEILNEKYCTGLFKSSDGTILDLAADNSGAKGYTNILNWMAGRVAGLRIITLPNGNRVPHIRGRLATIFIDESIVDVSFLNTLSVNDIAMIKVITGPFSGAPGNDGGGVIAIYTIKGED
jgi:hypothetical protein